MRNVDRGCPVNKINGVFDANLLLDAYFERLEYPTILVQILLQSWDDGFIFFLFFLGRRDSIQVRR